MFGAVKDLSSFTLAAVMVVKERVSIMRPLSHTANHVRYTYKDILDSTLNVGGGGQSIQKIGVPVSIFLAGKESKK